TFSFEPGDLVSQIMSYGAASTVDVAVTGPQYADTARFAQAVKAQLARQPLLADLRFGQSLRYPNLDVRIDRVAAGDLGVTADKVARAVVAGTASTRFVAPDYWRDPKSGVSYQVQVQAPQTRMTSAADLANLPVAAASSAGGGDITLGQVAELRQQT